MRSPLQIGVVVTMLALGGLHLGAFRAWFALLDEAISQAANSFALTSITRHTPTPAPCTGRSVMDFRLNSPSLPSLPFCSPKGTPPPIATARPANDGWDRTRALRMRLVGEPPSSEDHRVGPRGTGGLPRLINQAPYLADVWLDSATGCVHTVAWAQREFSFLDVRLSFADAAVYATRGRGEAPGSPLAYDNTTEQKTSEPFTTGAVCAPSLRGAEGVTVTASYAGTHANNTGTVKSDFVSLPTTVRPVPLPPRVADLAMCAFIGLDLALLPA